ncbi:hypothetical protein RRG08_015037 [Elysia crispata]|uniref:Uncharacterized protein n=1 Tax=Elysia crispata TaxID=231223 RepID=A0AAE1EA58_9GAST|nr:hypothetical protein RRG08_015037 [Elysia crispata]
MYYVFTTKNELVGLAWATTVRRYFRCVPHPIWPRDESESLGLIAEALEIDHADSATAEAGMSWSVQAEG